MNGKWRHELLFRAAPKYIFSDRLFLQLLRIFDLYDFNSAFVHVCYLPNSLSIECEERFGRRKNLLRNF